MKQLNWLVILIVVFMLPTLSASAINYNSGTYGSCQYSSCSITLTSNGSVSLNVTPSGAGSCTTASDTATVTTDDSNGYSLTLADMTTNTALVNGAATIPASGGSLVSPIPLTADRWGYRVDGVGGFGAGPTTAQSNVGLNSTTYAGIQPSNATADTIATTSVPANPAVSTTVWYSVCARADVVPGAYTTVVTYTAITN